VFQGRNQEEINIPGTATVTSPEQLKNSRSLSHRTVSIYLRDMLLTVPLDKWIGLQIPEAAPRRAVPS
jgi:hypothetical protein